MDTIVGVIAALISFVLAFHTSRIGSLSATSKYERNEIPKEFKNESFRILVYLIAVQIAYYFPIGDDAIKWSLLIVFCGVTAGFLLSTTERRSK